MLTYYYYYYYNYYYSSILLVCVPEDNPEGRRPGHDGNDNGDGHDPLIPFGLHIVHHHTIHTLDRT